MLRLTAVGECIAAGIAVGIIVSYAAVVSCTSDEIETPQCLENDQIDPELRQHIHQTNDRVIESIKRDDSETILALSVDRLTDEPERRQEIEDLVHEFSTVLRNEEFEAYADYYWEGYTDAENPIVVWPSSEDNCRIEVKAVTGRVFISLLLSNSQFQKFAMGLAYVWNGDEWYLRNLGAGAAELAGKTASEWQSDAQRLYDRGYLMPALLRQELAATCARPVSFLHCDEQADILTFLDQLQSLVTETYTFPIEIPDIASNPVVYRVETEFVGMEMFPKITYVTTHSLDDDALLTEEAQALAPIVQELFPGIGVDTTHLFFAIFTEPPLDPSREYTAKGITVEVGHSSGDAG